MGAGGSVKTPLDGEEYVKNRLLFKSKGKGIKNIYSEAAPRNIALSRHNQPSPTSSSFCHLYSHHKNLAGHNEGPFLPLGDLVLLCSNSNHFNGVDSSASHLYIRADGHRVTDPDNELLFEDPVTNTKTPKSRVLEIGEPEEARNRWFDWDESCTDQEDRRKITEAFRMAKDFARSASGFLDKPNKGLPKTKKKNAAVPENVEYIKKFDSAFTQMFFAQDNRIDYVKDSFDILVDRLSKYDGRHPQEGKHGLRFICDRKGQSRIWTADPTAGNHGPIEAKYSFDYSASIVFCPVFFDDEKFPNAYTLVNRKSDEATLKDLDCRESIMLHELLHLKFTRNISADMDDIGFEKAAKVAGKGTGARRKADWSSAKRNCDNYAWYAIYSFWNNPVAGCGDVWPSDVKKPNNP
ncbi:hypothetical protein AJ79_05307 [Helicocarpus griseus UAMH5409]|uniref:Lysine-specific metallo-endopeptidase domain-containing protein n=1 Tax=Helicocarpus griseus UAMH5409 TaxID=1447875 RepID=A0A2B7XNI0_9EURO|nr:hypothetical protein AJ79_05307 [Helicocarpus griseus UAMH5409]